KKETQDTGTCVHLKCDYPASHKENEKFLCKGENPFNCKELINTRENMSSGRISINDNSRRNYFYVYICNSSTADSGTYWCGSDRTWHPAKYTKIQLSVVNKRKDKRRNQSETSRHETLSTASSAMNSDLSTAKSGSESKSRTPKPEVSDSRPHQEGDFMSDQASSSAQNGAQTSSAAQRAIAGHNTEGNHDYEEIQMRPQQVDSGSAVTSVYATVSMSSGPSDQLQYASVTFHNDVNCSDEASVSVSAEGNILPTIQRCSSATNPPTAEPTLYSTVAKSRKQ
ncbi:hypothetical protein LDENG_00085340, partial [Lucifuga dentata]